MFTPYYSFPPPKTIKEEEEDSSRPGHIIQQAPPRPERLCGFKGGCSNKPYSIDGLCEKHYIEKETICNHSNCKREIYHNYLCWIHGGRRRCIERGCPHKEYSKVDHLCVKHYNIHRKVLYDTQRETNPRPKRNRKSTMETKSNICQEKVKRRTTASKKRYKCQHCRIIYKREWLLKKHLVKHCKKPDEDKESQARMA